MQGNRTKRYSRRYSGLTRRVCILFGILVLATELLKWWLMGEQRSPEFFSIIVSISLLAIIIGTLSGRVFPRRYGAWMCSVLLVCFPLIEGIQAGGINAMTLAVAVAFPVFFTLLLGPRHALLGSFAGTFLIVFLTTMPMQGIQTLITGSVLPVSAEILSTKSALDGIFAILICAAATFTLASQNRAEQEKLNQDARLDNLTGIPNRRAFDRQINNEIERARRAKRPLSVIVFDIDDFKIYNDHYGHQAGDLALQTVARAIDSVCVRSTDFVARYGGEEFVVLLPATTDDRAKLLAGKIRSNLRQLENGPVADRDITLSAGIAVLNGEKKVDANELFRRADLALYESKRSGKDRVTVYCNEQRRVLRSI